MTIISDYLLITQQLNYELPLGLQLLSFTTKCCFIVSFYLLAFQITQVYFMASKNKIYLWQGKSYILLPHLFLRALRRTSLFFAPQIVCKTQSIQRLCYHCI